MIMLVLARKPSEAIKIGDDIIIKVIAIRGGQVKIGIDAPPGVRVIRTDSHVAAPAHAEPIPERPNSGAAASQAKNTED